jgi:hypothetical protein
MWVRPLVNKWIQANVALNSTLVCNNGQVLWQRDVNACKNMFQIATSKFATLYRPIAFQRPVSDGRDMETYISDRRSEYGFVHMNDLDLYVLNGR